MPWILSTLAIVLAATLCPRCSSSTWMRWYPQVGLSVGQRHDQRGKIVRDRWSTEIAVWIRPVPRNEAAVPAKHRLGSHAERRPPLHWQKPAQRGEPSPIDRLQVRSRLLASQDLKLVTQHEDLDFLGLLGLEYEHHEREHTAYSEVGERPQLGTQTIWLAQGEG